MSKHSRAGGKFTGNHTTLIPAATIVCDIAAACPTVTKITPGFIKAGLKSVSGKRRVKILEKERVLSVSVRDNCSQQEIFVYGTDLRAANLAIANGSKKHGFAVTE